MSVNTNVELQADVATDPSDQASAGAAGRIAVRSLRGASVVSTRPLAQARELSEQLQALGARVIAFPSIEIGPPKDPRALAARLEALNDVDIILFVSRNAVLGFVAALPSLERLERVAVGALGAGTASELQAAGIEVALCPQSAYDSEALLALTGLAGAAVRGKRVLIVRGNGGRAKLGEVLLSRGARVDYAEVYQRRRPRLSPAQLNAVLDCPEPMCVVVTSDEGLTNFAAMLGEGNLDWLCQRRFVVVNDRMARRVRKIGIQPLPTVAKEASVPGLIEAVARTIAR